MDKEPQIDACKHCGSTALEAGKIKVYRGRYFNADRGENSGFGSYPLKAWMCKECGYVMEFAHGNLAELREIDALPTKEERIEASNVKRREAREVSGKALQRGCLVLGIVVVLILLVILIISNA